MGNISFKKLSIIICVYVGNIHEVGVIAREFAPFVEHAVLVNNVDTEEGNTATNCMKVSKAGRAHLVHRWYKYRLPVKPQD